MKPFQALAAVLARPARNEAAYSRFNVEKMLELLGVPEDPTVRLCEFRVDNPFGDADLRLDFLLVVDAEIPMVVIEAKRNARDFDKARDEAVNYARNFNPRESNIRRMMTVPFIIAAAGHRAEMYRATVRGIEIVYEPIRDGGAAVFLEWSELVEEAAAFRAVAGPIPPAATESPRAAAALEIELVKKFLDELYEAIYGKLRDRDDARVQLLDAIALAARDRDTEAALHAARQAKLPASAIARIRKALQRYDRALAGGLLGGAAPRRRIGTSSRESAARVAWISSRAHPRAAPTASEAGCATGAPPATSPLPRSSTRWCAWPTPSPARRSSIRRAVRAASWPRW